MVIIAPSLLAADFLDFGMALQAVEGAKADWVHYDVMDGDFVPVITFGHHFVAQAKKCSVLPADVHLMIREPWRQFRLFADAGTNWLTFHWEAAVHHHRHTEEIRQLGMRPGISIVPSTPVTVLSALLPFVDLVLVMTVNPGYGGQAFLPFCAEKLEWLRFERQRRGLDFLISVDGGVTAETAVQIKASGADILVTGSAFFSSPKPADFIDRLRQ